MDIRTGQRVQLVRDVERFPHFTVWQHARGTVTEATADVVTVRIDGHIEGAEPWDNEIVWQLSEGDDPSLDLMIVTGADA